MSQSTASELQFSVNAKDTSWGMGTYSTTRVSSQLILSLAVKATYISEMTVKIYAANIPQMRQQFQT